MYIKKRLFIQKCICAPHLSLKLCLMNWFIKKLTRYQFDWGQLRGLFSRHTYINLYLLICTYMKPKLSTSTYLTQKTSLLKDLDFGEKGKSTWLDSNHKIVWLPDILTFNTVCTTNVYVHFMYFFMFTKIPKRQNESFVQIKSEPPER